MRKKSKETRRRAWKDREAKYNSRKRVQKICKIGNRK